MQSKAFISIGLLMSTAALTPAESPTKDGKIYPEIQSYLAGRIAEFDEISAERKDVLNKLAAYIQSQVAEKRPAKLTFLCTHNSRRSHLSQIWAAVAAEHYGIPNVETYSGGTEATAFHPRAIAALERTGLKIETMQDGKNPRYAVRFHDTDHPLVCFSKVYRDAPNPTENFCAVMTCTQADKGCPVVAGCSLRVALPYDDPKIADGTPDETKLYDARSCQICREMLYVFSQVELAE